jgi:RND superfamily putative drug exporter
MLRRIINFATRFPKSVITVWVIGSLILGGYAGQLGYKVMTDDIAGFLPKSAESARAAKYGQEHFGQQKGARTVIVLVKRADGHKLTAADRAHAQSLVKTLPQTRLDTHRPAMKNQPGNLRARAGGIVAAAPGPVAPDGRFAIVGLRWKGNTTDPVAQDYYLQIRDRAAAQLRSHGLRVGFTGGIASLTYDMKANKSTKALGQWLLMGAIVLLSLLFFRAPLAALLPLFSIFFVVNAASGLVVLAAYGLGFQLDVSTVDLITVVLAGIGVDYFLFLLFRLRERLRAGEGRRLAARNAAGAVGPVIASAAFAIVTAFATLALAQFGQFRILGPSIAISVFVMLFAGITLFPAVAAVTGRAMFFPSRSWSASARTAPPPGSAAASPARPVASRSPSSRCSS